jgi:hypothetical protein
VWNQPVEVREMRKDGRWSPEEIASRFDEVGVERMTLIDRLEEYRKAAAAEKAKN